MNQIWVGQSIDFNPPVFTNLKKIIISLTDDSIDYLEGTTWEKDYSNVYWKNHDNVVVVNGGCW